MNKKLLAVLCFIAIAVGVFAFASRPSTKGQTSANGQSQSGLGTRESPHPSSAPEHVVYRQFFHHLTTLKERAADLERKGGDGRGLRSYFKNKAGLNDAQARALDQVAEDCEREVAKMDAKAKKIIDAFRARFPEGRVPSDHKVPTLPAELQTMQQQRDMTILQARQRLRGTLGEQAFRQLDDFIKIDAERNVRPAQFKQAVPSQSGANK